MGRKGWGIERSAENLKNKMIKCCADEDVKYSNQTELQTEKSPESRQAHKTCSLK